MATLYYETVLKQLLTGLCTFRLFIHATKTFSHNNLLMLCLKNVTVAHKVLHEATLMRQCP